MFNWAKSYKLADPGQIVQPKTVSELQATIRLRKSHQKIKVLGSSMSFLGIGALDKIAGNTTDGDIMLDLSAFEGQLESSETSATFGASTKLSKVTQILADKQLQLCSCPGVLTTQTLAGAIATGTHGQGFRNGGLYDSVQRISIVMADGSFGHFARDDPADNFGLFDAFRLHLGGLGVLVYVTVDVEPLQTFHLTKSITNFEDLYENFIRWNEDADHCKAWWFPKTDHVQLWQTRLASSDEVYLYEKHGKTLYTLPATSNSSESFNKQIDQLVVKMDKDTKAKDESYRSFDPLNEHNARFRTVLRFRSLEACLGNMYQLWCKGIPAPQVNCELAIPIGQLKEALMSLRKYCHESKKEMHYPFILRAAGPSTAWLSPSHNQKVVYIGFLVYLSEDRYNADTNSLQFLQEIEAVLAQHGAIPHYGKFMTVSRYNFSKLLPKWKQFIQLQKTVDPEGVFVNAYLKSLFGSTTQPEVMAQAHL